LGGGRWGITSLSVKFSVKIVGGKKMTASP